MVQNSQPSQLTLDQGPSEAVDSDNKENDFDSGYSSLVATAFEKDSGQKELKQAVAAGCSRTLWSPHSDLACFSKPLDGLLLAWYQTRGPQIERLLVAYLKSGHRLLPRKFKPIAVRLMVLGRNEADARPHLVVFAPSKGSRKVESFFVEEDIKELLATVAVSGTDLASIPVIVTSHPDTGFLAAWHLASNLPVLCPNESWGNLKTFCGLPIRVNNRQLTFGGLIRIARADTFDTTIYGLSAGHFLEDDQDGDTESEDDDLDSGNNSNGIDPVQTESMMAGELPLSSTLDIESPICHHTDATTLGDVLVFHGTDPTVPDLDWSLIEVRTPGLPNLIDAKPGDGLRKAHLVTPVSHFPIGSSPREVIAMSGTRGLQRGTLHFVPARVMLGRSESFSDAHILKLQDGTIEQGDSGSWVVDLTTYEVLGHVVGKDVLGDAYVIPMTQTFESIKSRLGVTQVSVAEFLDFLPGIHPHQSFESLPGSASAMPPEPSFRSRYIDSGYATNSLCTPDLMEDDVLGLLDGDISSQIDETGLEFDGPLQIRFDG
ncbi:hypothetical protein QBC44DRAFT_337691 [Cladorrhinum sp. PSN332]|nr:hypothetical protein QBC44DRAFT_337691 [Cladorrhinum sp. PSN332]